MGELDREGTRATAAHLRSCPQCTNELIDMAVAHAALQSAMTYESPFSPSETWDDGDDLDDMRSGPSLDGSPPRLGLLTLAASESDDAPPTGRPARSASAWVAGAAAVAAAVAGVWGVASASQTVPAPTQAAITLHPLSAFVGTASASVTMASGPSVTSVADQTMVVTPSGLASPPAGRYYEVWLWQPSTNKVAPVGLLDNDGANHYQVPTSMLRSYSAVEVSLQQDDGSAAHSPISLLRGHY